MARQLDMNAYTTRIGSREIAIDTPRALGLAAITAVLVAVVGTYLFVSNFYGKVVPGVHVDGVPIGGLPPDSASTALIGRAKTIGEARLQLRADDQSWEPTLNELGVAVDARGLADRAYAIGRDGSPLQRSITIGSALFRPVELTAPTLDRARLTAWVDQTGAHFDRPPIDAALTLSPTGQVQLTQEQVGRALDRPAAVEALNRAIEDRLKAPSDAPAPAVDLPFATIQPALTSAAITPARAQAEAALARPFVLKMDADSWRLEPAELARLLSFRRDGAAMQVDVEGAALAGLLDRIAGQADRRPKDATLALSPDGKVQFTPDQPGRDLDRAAAREQLRAALLSPSPTGELQLPAVRIPAQVRADDLAAARTALDRAMSGPTRLVAGDKTVELQPKDVAPILRIVNGSAGAATIEVDEAKLRPALEKLAREVDRAPKNARLRIVGGSGAKPGWLVGSMPNGGPDAGFEVLQPGQAGQKLDVARALEAAKRGLVESNDRVIALPIQTTNPIDADARASFGPLEFIDGGTTSYAGSIPARAHNLELAASRLDGYVVPPGVTFSFNEAIGSTSLDNGYKIAWGIAGDANGKPKTVPSVAGGICQIATTLFHGVFWSGMPIEERNWHLYWIPKYGVQPRGITGLDAAVDEESGVDLKWTNATDTPIIIQARTDGNRVSFALYGKKPDWKVDVANPIVGGWVKADTRPVTQPEPSMPAGQVAAVEEARDGFTATNVRTVTPPGGEPRVLRLTSVYQPSRNVTLVGTGGR